MAAITYTADDLAQIKKAILNGATEVRFQDRTVKYRSLEELTSIVGLVEGQMQSQPATRQVRMWTHKGF